MAADSTLALEEAAPVLSYLELRTALSRYQKPPSELEPKQRAAVRHQASRELEIGTRVLGSPEARAVVVPEATLTQAVDEIRARYPDEDEFRADLARNGMNQDSLRSALHRELKVEAVLDRVAARAAEVSELDVMIYYYMHPDRFQAPETRTVRHILITVNEDIPENRREAAFARIRSIAARLARKPSRFEEQAIKHSECPSALHGGLIGRVPEGKLFPELDQVLFALDAGALSEIVESSMGFHVLWCEAVHPPGTVSFQEAEPRIREVLEKRRRRMCQRYWLNELGSRETDHKESSHG